MASEAAEPDQITAYVRRRLELDPLHEPSHRILIELQARAGNRSAALQHYQAYTALLQDELGIEPADEFQFLRPTHNLPASVTSFIGGEAELAQIDETLERDDCRLLTILGPGGIGKTRLAQESSRELSSGFKDGACFISLEAVENANLMPTALLNALDISHAAETDSKQRLINQLYDRELLLVLENFEHLAWDGSDLILLLLQSSPGLRILITSRERTNLPGEWVWRKRNGRTHVNT